VQGPIVSTSGVAPREGTSFSFREFFSGTFLPFGAFSSPSPFLFLNLGPIEIPPRPERIGLQPASRISQYGAEPDGRVGRLSLLDSCELPF